MPTVLEFHVISPKARVPQTAEGPVAYLNEDKWDDWGKFCTQYFLTVVDEQGTHHHIGDLKIGERGLKPHRSSPEPPVGYREPDVPFEFSQLGEEFFSLGQSEDYYANLTGLGNALRERILTALCDVAWDEERWNWAKSEEVMTESLLRSLTQTTVEGQFRRMANGHARVTSYRFDYAPPASEGPADPPFNLKFRVDPESSIPTNVHVLIGRNGVGKTHLLSLMAKSLAASESIAPMSGEFDFLPTNYRDPVGFANVVSVSFSAFEAGIPLADREPAPGVPGYSYIGLHRLPVGETSTSLKSPDELAEDFARSLSVCRVGAREQRWRRAITTLQSDPRFREAELASLVEPEVDEEGSVASRFKDLSSGHKIVLLTLTRLVEKVEERTLVLIDEPESHLHPPLLSALTRALSELMVDRNGVAIVATHSPVVLQEVPKSCVWILSRSGSVWKAERPTIQTFAEGVGVLSREVFRLELTESGYHNLLAELREATQSYDEGLAQLEGQLGGEGRAVLRSMFLSDLPETNKTDDFENPLGDDLEALDE